MPKERTTRQPGAGHARNIRIPGHLMDRVEVAMEFEGVSNFTQFALSALTAKCREVEAKMPTVKKLP